MSAIHERILNIIVNSNNIMFSHDELVIHYLAVFLEFFIRLP